MVVAKIPLTEGLACRCMNSAGPDCGPVRQHIGGQGYHLWYDENGQAVSPIRLAARAGKPAGQAATALADPEGARQQLQDCLQRFEDQREDEAMAREKGDRLRPTRTKCAPLHRRAQQPGKTSTARPAGCSTADGVRRLTDQERQAQINGEPEDRRWNVSNPGIECLDAKAAKTQRSQRNSMLDALALLACRLPSMRRNRGVGEQNLCVLCAFAAFES